MKSKRKGNRVELELCKKLTEHFGDEFSRSVGSGNRWGQVNYLPEHARKTLVGDICVPEKFLWVIECKGGYDDDVDFSSVLDSGCATIDKFIEQSEFDAGQCDRKPIIFWKRSRKPWVAMLKRTDTLSLMIDFVNKPEIHPIFKYSMQYNEWYIVCAQTLLDYTDRNFWFDK